MKPPSPSSRQAVTAIAGGPGAHAILDIEDGLDRIMGDRVLYFKLLRRFRHDYVMALPRLRDTVRADRYGAARIMAHTLKGAAGMIGARCVQAHAEELESALRAQSLALEAQLTHLEQALSQTLATINSVLHDATDDSAPPPSAAEPADPANLLLIGRLAYFLQEGDGAAIDVLESSATILAAMLGVEAYQQVAAAAHEFDFDAALAALQQRR